MTVTSTPNGLRSANAQLQNWGRLPIESMEASCDNQPNATSGAYAFHLRMQVVPTSGEPHASASPYDRRKTVASVLAQPPCAAVELRARIKAVFRSVIRICAGAES